MIIHKIIGIFFFLNLVLFKFLFYYFYLIFIYLSLLFIFFFFIFFKKQLSPFVECSQVQNYYNLYDTTSVDLLREGNCSSTSCNITETVISVTSETSCLTINDCTGFRCCVDFNRLSRSFVFGVYINACNSTLTLIIEKLEYIINLAGFNFGKFIYV
jgi:hypothetical protein